MKFFACIAVLLLAAAPSGYSIDLARYFADSAAEGRARAAVEHDTGALVASPPPATAAALVRWLRAYDDLLRRAHRHDAYLYLASERDDTDVADSRADDAIGALLHRLDNALVSVAQRLGDAGIARMARDPAVAPYAYLLRSARSRSAHRLGAAESRAVDAAVTPVLRADAAAYAALRKSAEPSASNQDAYAALLISIVTADDGVARLRGFAGAPDAAYFDRSIPSTLPRILDAVRASKANAEYRRVAARAPNPAFSPAPMPIDAAVPVILSAERTMGEEYAHAYEALLDPSARRLEICTAEHCDRTGFSVGFSHVESAAFFGGYNGTLAEVRAVAHESGHAVHRAFMSAHQPIAAYNTGPHYLFESFAIFNELLFIDHLAQTAADDRARAYYLNYFLRDATFQVFGSAEETELESAIDRGIADRTIRTASGLDEITSTIAARYDPSAQHDPQAALAWARNRLFYTDPQYDVNYLYAGLLALRYFAAFERDPHSFPPRYVALLENGFTDTPENLERRFLGIDLDDPAGLVAGATAMIDERTHRLERLSPPAPPE